MLMTWYYDDINNDACLSKTEGCLSSLEQSEGSNSLGQAVLWMEMMSKCLPKEITRITLTMPPPHPPRILCESVIVELSSQLTPLPGGTSKHREPAIFVSDNFRQNICFAGVLITKHREELALTVVKQNIFDSGIFVSPVVGNATRVWAVCVLPNVIVGERILSCFWSESEVTWNDAENIKHLAGFETCRSLSLKQLCPFPKMFWEEEEGWQHLKHNFSPQEPIVLVAWVIWNKIHDNPKTSLLTKTKIYKS